MLVFLKLFHVAVLQYGCMVSDIFLCSSYDQPPNTTSRFVAFFHITEPNTYKIITHTSCLAMDKATSPPEYLPIYIITGVYIMDEKKVESQMLSEPIPGKN